jgi:CubicO group peptidase (beta-lactamase class C family)
MTALDTVRDAMQRYHVPGVAVGILRAGAEDIHTFGVTSVDNPLPIQPSTLFQVGSITKTITATAIMRLVEQGTLDLETPVRRYLPDLQLHDADVTQRLTLRHLVTHTAGFVGDDFTDPGAGDDALARYVANVAELPQVTPLGELWSYCNSGFAIAGRVVEVVRGQPYELAARELVLEPLGMDHSFFSAAEVMTYRFVVGHTSPFTTDGELEVARPWPLARAANPVGGLISCVPDLLRYARFLLGEGPAGVLSPESLRQMQWPLAPAGNFADSVGVAWMLRSVAGARVVEHSGGTWGQQTTLKVLPDHGYGQVILTNASRGAELHGWLSAVLLEEHLGLSSPLPQPVPMPPERLAEYVGHYDAWVSTLDVTAAGGEFLVQVHDKGGFPTKGSPPGPPRPPGRFGMWKDDYLIGLEAPYRGARAEFVRDAAGHIAYLRFGGRLATRR